MKARRIVALAVTAATASGLVLPARPAAAVTTNWWVTGRVSVTSAGVAKAQALGDVVQVSANGRYVAFTTTAALQADDTNDATDAYLRDRVAGTTVRVSLNDADQQISGDSSVCGMSRDGRQVLFVGRGPGLPVPASDQLYVRDRTVGTTAIVSVSSAEVPSSAGASSGLHLDEACPISDDGRYVAFTSTAGTLAPGDNNGSGDDVFRRDLQLGTTARASVSSTDVKGNGVSRNPALSADGSTIAFTSFANNLVANDTNAAGDVFVHAFNPAGTYRMSLKSNGAQVLGESGEPSISADGLKISFSSFAVDLVANDTNSVSDVFIRNRQTSITARASLYSSNGQMPGGSSASDLSDDGRYVSFSMINPDSMVDDENLADDIFRRDLTNGTTWPVSIDPSGSAGDGGSYRNAISGDGLVVAFQSAASDLVRNDGGSEDVFVRDYQEELTPFASELSMIEQQFTDFEGRPPTAAELAEWQARFGNGERNTDQVIDDLAHGTTFAGKRAPLIRLYWAFFVRPPDVNGLEYWRTKLTNGSKLASVAKQFATSSEFQTKYGSKTNSQFVTLIYQNIFHRDPDPSGLAYWTNKLTTKQKTRGDVMVNFSESSEGQRVLAPQTDTILHHLGMLHTMPSKLYVDLFVGSLKGPWISQVQVGSIRTSSDYAARVTP